MIVCYAVIKQPLGPERCLLHKRVTNNTLYEFNLFYKYLCLSREGVILDTDPTKYLNQDSIDSKDFDKIEKGLKLYEENGPKP